MYSVVDYGEMLRDGVRLRAYEKALAAVVPGKKVVEIGGGTGFFACLASKLSAAHVTSIDLNPLIVSGPQTATNNGLSNIEFVFGRSQAVSLDEPADVVLHDLRGNLPIFDDSLATLRDARRFLASDGVYLPRRDRIFASLVEDEQTYREMEGVWAGQVSGLSVSHRRSMTHRLLRYVPSKDSRCLTSEMVCEIDYSQIEALDVENSLQLDIEEAGTSHGLALWFETELVDDVGYSTNPWLPEDRRAQTYGVAFLPWPNPISIEAGHSYELKVEIDRYGSSSCELHQVDGRLRVLLGAFAGVRPTSDTPDLQLSSRFSPFPNIKAYRVAFQALERGDKVQVALERLRKACPQIQDEQTAIDILLKCSKLTQIPRKSTRVRSTILRFENVRIGLRTDCKELHQAVLDYLAPAWRSTRTKSQNIFWLTLCRTLSSRGRGYSLEFAGTNHFFTDLPELTEQLARIVSRVVIGGSGDYALLACQNVKAETKAALILDDPEFSKSKFLTVLNKDGDLVPYAIRGADSVNQKPLAISEVHLFMEGATKAYALSLLLNKCLNLDTLTQPLDYFSKLLQGTKIVDGKL